MHADTHKARGQLCTQNLHASHDCWSYSLHAEFASKTTSTVLPYGTAEAAASGAMPLSHTSDAQVCLLALLPWLFHCVAGEEEA
jgi:hypothetical protein